MRIAILADIHGNLQAFEAALEHVRRQRVDQLIIAGDVINGAPDSAACLELALSLGCPILRGNHERYVADFGTPRALPIWSTERFAPLQWTVAQLSDAQRELVGAWPLSYCPPDAGDLLVVHSSLRSDVDLVRPYEDEERLAQMFPGVREALILRGHYHLAETRVWGRRLIVTSGSVGMPLDSRTEAQYVIAERRGRPGALGGGWRVQHHAVPYDLAATLRRFEQSGYLAATHPMGELYLREIATASYYLVPFLRAYERWTQREPLGLAQGVERFLRAGPR